MQRVRVRRRGAEEREFGFGYGGGNPAQVKRLQEGLMPKKRINEPLIASCI